MPKHVFPAILNWTGSAAGPAQNYASYSRAYVIEIEGKPALHGSADPAFRGDGALHNPEDLLVASLSACHLLSYLALCTRGGIAVVSYDDSARGTMQEKDGAMRFTEVLLRPRCTVIGDLAKAQRLHDEAHAQCFIANSVNFPVRHEATVTAAT